MAIIIKIDYVRLRNEVHVELHDTVNRLFDIYTPVSLGIVPQYNVYKPLYDIEVSALDVVLKSGYTGEIDEQDHRRGHIFRGFSDAVKSAMNHFDIAKLDAANKIANLLEHYGNVSIKTIDQETAAIDDMLREFETGIYPELIQILALEDWLTQLKIENNKLKELMMARYDESAQRPDIHMRTARINVDKAFKALIAQLEALTLVNGKETYDPFMRELNAIIERYKNILAQEKGERKKKN
jgi:hypothetical protein